MPKIGLIAGNRKFPLLFAQAAKQKGYEIVAVAIKAETPLQIKKICDKVYWLSLKDYSRMFAIFQAEGISEVVMAGQVSPGRLFSKEVSQDAGLKKILAQLKDKKADTIFSAVAAQLESSGLKLLSSITFLEDYLPKKGVLTQKAPSPEEWEDINFGFELARQMGALDIGQTVAVKQKAVIAVEALEGTDNLIRRAGRIGREGVTVVKVSKPKQDMRFDVPVIGLNTVKNLIRIKAACMAIEAEKTLFIDRKQSVGLAEKHNLCLVAI